MASILDSNIVPTPDANVPLLPNAASIPATQVNTSGGFNPAEENLTEQNKTSGLGVVEGIQKAYQLSKQPTGDLYDFLKQTSNPTDPNFKPEDHVKELEQAGIDHSKYDDFMQTRSNIEFEQMKASYTKEINDQATLSAMGWKGIVGSALAAITDPVSAIAAMATAGATKLGTLEAVGLQGTRAASITRNAVVGAGANVGAAAVTAATSPTGSWTDIPNAGLQGLTLGAVAGTVLPKDMYEVNHFNQAADEVRSEFNAAQNSGWAGSRDPRNFDKPESIFTPRETTTEPIKTETEANAEAPVKKTNMESEGSIGAAQVNPTDKPSVSGSTEQLMEDSKQYLRGTDWVNKTEFRETPAGDAAKMFYDVMKKTPFASDWDKLANSDSTIAQAMAHKIFESPSGIVRNNRSAAMLKDYYENNLLDVNRGYATHFDSYAKEQNISMTDPSYHFELPQKFDSDVMQEMNSRYHDFQSHPASSDSVKKMADTIDHYSSKAIDYLKGEEGDIPVAGSDTMETKSGWMPQKWRGENMRQIIKDYPNGEKNIAQGIANSYQRTYNMTPEDALVYAKAVVRGSLAREDGIGTNMIQLLRTDGKATFEKFLSDNGYPENKIQPLIEKLLGHVEQAGQESFTKARLDVDLREKIPGTNKSIQDLVDNNVRKIWSKYSRQASGSAALARHGIQRADKQGIINAIKQEVAAKGDTSIPANLLDNLFSHFEGGPAGGGLSRATIMATRLSDLALLNSLGLTKMSEVGAMIGAVGIKAFKDTAPAEVKAMLSGEKTPIIKELERLTGPVGDTETLHNDAFTFEEMKKDANIPNELLNYTSQMVNKGKRLQGFISGFYHVHTLQQRVAVTSMVQKLDTLLKGDLNNAKIRRLYDMGMDKDLTQRVADNFQKLSEHDEDGHLTSLNLDKWEPKDREDFRLALNRHTYQTLQRSMAGEGSMWWHSDFGSLFTHLKQFTLGSIQKQVLRNMALADPEAMASVTYGLMTAAAAFTAQKIVHGQADQITPTKVMKGAIGLSNFTTFIPSMVDPVFSILGMENMKFDHYGQTDISTGIVPTPVVVPSLNRLLHIPGALYGLASGHYTKGDVHALQAMPLIGNAPGIGAIWNAMYTPPPKGHHKK